MDTTTKATMSQLIEQFAQVREERVPTSVHLRWDEGPEVKRANTSLSHMNDDEAQEFLRQLLGVWCDASDYRMAERLRALAELHVVLGDRCDAELGRGLVYTLSGNGRQFRAWYGKPGGIGMEHVDSAGEGLLFTIHGMRGNVQRYIDALLHARTREHAIVLPNGGVLYGFYWCSY